MAVRGQVMIVLGVLAGMFLVSVYAQSLSERIYLPTLNIDPTPTSPPTATVEPSPTTAPTPEPTAAPVLPPWRRPDSPYVQLNIVDIQVLGSATLVVTVRNDGGRTVSGVVLTRVVYDSSGAYLGERSERYSGAVRVLPGELETLRMFGYLPPSPPASRIEGFAIPE